jgi:hypothetical protein
VEIMLFAGHYPNFRGRAHNCGNWTKRDAFVLMNCDNPCFHTAPMADASILLLSKTKRALQFVDEWLYYCCIPEILTDQSNACGLENLETFADHRHDQSVLSLLAARHSIELFRGPSQFGNHAKSVTLRRAGELLVSAYGSEPPYENSTYETLIDHHRLRMNSLSEDTLDAKSSCIEAMREHYPVDAGPTRMLLVGDVGIADREQIHASWPRTTIEVLESDGGRSHRWSGVSGSFQAVFCSHYCPADAIPFGMLELFCGGLLDREFVICWSNLARLGDFVRSVRVLRSQFGAQLSSRAFLARNRDRDRIQVAAILSGLSISSSLRTNL